MVIDSSALLALHLNEPGYETIFAKIADAIIAVIGAPTLLETAMALMSSLRQLRVEVIPFNEDHYNAASEAFLDVEFWETACRMR